MFASNAWDSGFHLQVKALSGMYGYFFQTSPLGGPGAKMGCQDRIESKQASQKPPTTTWAILALGDQGC